MITDHRLLKIIPEDQEILKKSNLDLSEVIETRFTETMDFWHI